MIYFMIFKSFGLWSNGILALKLLFYNSINIPIPVSQLEWMKWCKNLITLIWTCSLAADIKVLMLKSKRHSCWTIGSILIIFEVLSNGLMVLEASSLQMCWLWDLNINPQGRKELKIWCFDMDLKFPSFADIN